MASANYNQNITDTDKKESQDIHSKIYARFSSTDHIKSTKANITKLCFDEVLSCLSFKLVNNQILLDYRYFKFISAPENYELLLFYITSVINDVLLTHNNFIFHVNMDTLTLLHIEKHYSFIKKIAEVLKTTFPDKLEICYIYNAPFIFSKLFSVISAFIDKKTQQKIRLVKDG
jgi:hypothetical protein